MSPAAGGAAPAQSAPAAAIVAPAIAVQDSDRAPARRDPPGPAEGADPANAAARKTAWGVPAPPPAAVAAASPVGGIIGGDASWPALVESKRGSKSASSDSLKSLSDSSGPSAQEDPIAVSVSPHPAVEAKPICTGSNPTTMLPPNAAAAASSQQNGSTTQPNPGRRSGSNGGNSGGNRGNGSIGSRRASSSSGGGGSSGSGGDGNRNGGSHGGGSSCNNSNGDGGSNLNDNILDSSSENDNEGSRNAMGNNIRGAGGRSSNGSGDGSNRNSGGSNNHWNNNPRSGNGTSNGGVGRGGYRSRRDHDRGGNFSPRNYPRTPVIPYHHQQSGVYQPSSFHRPPPPPPAHFMVPQHFVPYAPPFAYHGDVQAYPFYLPPVEQFQNMNLVRPPAQPSWVPQDQSNLAADIRTQIEFYFSTNNLCRDTFLRGRMNNQGWVDINLILSFPRMRTFTGLVDTNYILDAIRGSESLEVQGNNVRRRNDWAEWLLQGAH